MRGAPAARGFTLTELLLGVAVAGVLAGVALPQYQGALLKGRRADATSALGRLQAAEERQRAHHGAYSADFAALGLPARSEQGFYELQVELQGPEAYVARAVPAAGSPQQADADCPAIGLQVRLGFATALPDARCWNRPAP